MKTRSVLFACIATFVTVSGCSKAESATEGKSDQTTVNATTAIVSTERPRFYYDDEDGTDANSDALTITEELARDFAPDATDIATFDGFESLSMNGYTFTVCIYTSKGTKQLPYRFAGLSGVVEKDTNGIPYITCPVTPGPSGTFAIPNSINSIPILFISNNAFDGCSAMEHVIFPDSLQYIGDEAFYNCSGLLDLSIPENVKEIGEKAFWGCSSLKSVQIHSQPNDFKIRKEAFANCNSIQDLSLPQGDTLLDTTAFNFAIDTVPSSWTFKGIKTTSFNGYSFTVCLFSPSKKDSIFPNEFGCLLGSVEHNTNGVPLLTCPVTPNPSGVFAIPETIDGVPISYIAEQAFAKCSNIESIVFPTTIKYIGEESFRDCTGLKQLILPNNILEIDDAAFMGCTNLKSVKIDMETHGTYIGPRAFANCRSIESLSLPQGDIHFAGSAFENAFEKDSFQEGPFCFGNRYFGISGTNHTHISISNGFHIVDTFYDDLKTIANPFSLYVDSGFVDEDGHAIIPSEVYSGLTNLHSLVIGPHVRQLGGFCFSECPNLTNLVFQGEIEKVNGGAFINSKHLSVDPFPFGKSPRSALMAFDPSVLQTMRKQTHKPLSQLRFDCGLILNNHGVQTDSQEALSALRLKWEQIAGDILSILNPVLGSNLPLSDDDSALVCETLDFLRTWKRLFFKPKIPDYVLDPKTCSIITVPPSKDKAETHYDILLEMLTEVFSSKYEHPCAQFRLAQLLAKENKKTKAAELYQKAAVGFASNLCPRVSHPDIFKSSPLENAENAISECIQAIDSLGFQTLAEALILQTQMIRSQQKEAPETSHSLVRGTAWFINDSTIVTCHHVIEDCKEIWTETENRTRIDFAVLAEDPNNDIAILKAKSSIPNHSSLPLSSKLGSIASKVFTVGYPLPDIMGSEKKYNDGTISALSGIGNDNRFYQVSIPIQPGNSGGAVVSEEGLVIGLAAAALDAEKVFKLTGSIPQNVNYAIKSRYITALLQDNGIPYDETPPKSGTDTKAIVDQVSRATILLKAK